MKYSFCPLVIAVAAVASTMTSCDAFATPKPAASFVAQQRHHTQLAETVENEPAPSNDSPYGDLPEIQGDFDWDSKFAGDPDWITEDVPGKIVMNEIDLAAQVTTLNKMEEEYKKQRLQKEYEDSQTVGWVASAELLNGRTAMFFLATGLLTELWTGTFVFSTGLVGVPMMLITYDGIPLKLQPTSLWSFHHLRFPQLNRPLTYLLTYSLSLSLVYAIPIRCFVTRTS